MSWNNLPPEVTAAIFNHLPVYDVKTASDTSREWSDIASNLVLIPKGHLLLKHPPAMIRQTPVHTIHIDGSHKIRRDFNQIQARFDLSEVQALVLYGSWTVRNLNELSECFESLPGCTTLEINNAKPAKSIFDFLLPRHSITKVKCYLQSNWRQYRKLRNYFSKIHGLFEEVVITLKTNSIMEVYAPKIRAINFPDVELTESLTVHPARLSQRGFETIRNLPKLENLHLKFPGKIPENVLTDLSTSPLLKRVTLQDAKSVPHDLWKKFFKSKFVRSLEELSITGTNQLDSSIFDDLETNLNLKKLYLEMSSPCFVHQCKLASIFAWCSNAQVLVLCVPFSPMGLDDLMQISKDSVTNLKVLKMRFQLCPDMNDPLIESSSFESRSKEIAEGVMARLPKVHVGVEFKTHHSEFLCDDNDDYD